MEDILFYACWIACFAGFSSGLVLVTRAVTKKAIRKYRPDAKASELDQLFI